METFLLIHGAFHGGWCWQLLADCLVKAGHRVYTPTLAGLGECAQMDPQTINLDTHIEDVCAAIESNDLRKVTLVGHSYGGMPITGAADRMPDRIQTIIYLDAMIPQNGKSALDIRYPFQTPFPQPNKLGLIEPIPASAFNVDGALGEWVDHQLTPQPVMTVTQPIQLTGHRLNIQKKIYIRAKGYNAPYFDRFFKERSSDPTWITFLRPWGHDMMITNPKELAQLLIDILSSKAKP